MRHNSYEPSRKRNQTGEQQTRGYGIQMVAIEEENEDSSNNQANSSEYIYTGEETVHEETYDSSLHEDEADQAHGAQSPQNGTSSENQSPTKPHTKQRNAPRNVRDKAPPYGNDASTNTQHRRPKEEHPTKERKHKRINKKIAGSRARIMLSRVLDEMGSRLYQEQPLQGKLPRLGKYIEPIAAPKDRPTQQQQQQQQQQRNNSKN